MPKLPKIKRRNRDQEHVDRPHVVTGEFELNYEDVIHKHGRLVVALFTTGLLALAIFVPRVVHQSAADVQRGTVEIESGRVSNPAFVSRINGDISAGNDSYVEFSGIPCVQQATTHCDR